jgi:ketosteroid isomerase-like protein
MSRENVEVVRRLYDALGRRDSEAVLALYDSEVEIDVSHGLFRFGDGKRVYHGHDGLRRWTGEAYEAWENAQADIEELIEAGDHVVSVAKYRMRGRASGIEVIGPIQAIVWTIRDGKIVRLVLHPSREAALEAVGLRE